MTDSTVLHCETFPFGNALAVERRRFDNGLVVLTCEDHSAPVVAYHTWFHVGSAHEVPGKTGLAHLLEHLMFNEFDGIEQGEFDARLEDAGAENNASTWLDWTHYTIALPADQLATALDLEPKRMTSLLLRPEPFASELEVVANERRYRVDDDPEGLLGEVLWGKAFPTHPYGIPTIGYMEDILGLTREDCQSFYDRYYGPNNATLVVVGDFHTEELLPQLQEAYGPIAARPLPAWAPELEPPRAQEVRLRQPAKSATAKLLLAYPSPAMSDRNHGGVALVFEAVAGGASSPLYHRLVRELNLATDVRPSVGTFRHPSISELFIGARPGVSADALLSAVDEFFATHDWSDDDFARARSRLDLAFLSQLDTAEGKATSIGFHQVLLGVPQAGWLRQEELATWSPEALRELARQTLVSSRRVALLSDPAPESES